MIKYLSLLLLFLVWAQESEEFTSKESRQGVEALLNLSRQSSESFDFALLQKYLLLIHPNDVRLEELKNRALWLEELIQERHEVEGLLFPLLYFKENEREYYQLNRGGDVALFSGTYLAGQGFRFLCEPNSDGLKRMAKSVEGIYKITHITGVSGLLCRFAIPLKKALEARLLPNPKEENLPWYHLYLERPEDLPQDYTHIHRQIASQNCPHYQKSPLGQFLTPEKPYYESQFYYTRTTRDQLTGVLFGLAVTLYALEPETFARYHVTLNNSDQQLAKQILMTTCEIALDIFIHLEENSWDLKDPFVKKSGTSADDVSELLKLSVQMLARRALMNLFREQIIFRKNHPGKVVPILMQEQFQKITKAYEYLKKEDVALLPSGLRRLEGMTDLFSSATWYSLTINYYAWNLRTLRVFTVILLDAPFEDARRYLPESWPLDSLSLEKINERNRLWMDFWNRYIWKQIGRDGNVWFTYLYNYARRLVFERHLGLFIPSSGLFDLQKKDFDYWFWWREDWKVLEQLRDQVLFSPSALYAGNQQTFGVGLERAHFHLRSIAITPIRSYSRPTQQLNRKQLQLCYSEQYGRKIIPPHLRPFSRFWLEGKDPNENDSKSSLDTVGHLESILIDLPVLYWLGQLSGVLEYRYEGFYDYEYHPPAKIKAKKE